MKTAGIIGGVGPQATAYIYKQLIEVAQSQYGAKNNDDYPSVVIASVPVPDFISSTEHMQKAEDMLVEAAKRLEAAGCDALCIGSNTVHILLDKLKKEVSVPFLSMVELVAERCAAIGNKKVALLGTPILLESGLYDEALKARGIILIKPSVAEIEVCDSVIRCVIAGETIDPIKKEYVAVLTSMLNQGADAIILGCTELPLVIDYEVLGDKIVKSDRVLAEGIAKYCLS